MRPNMRPDVQSAFDAFPDDVRHRLLAIRATIFAVAKADPRIGAITETLKWGEPAYLTVETGSGSTIRLGRSGPNRSRAALFFHCRTVLVADFRERFGGLFDYEGNRCVLLPAEPLPEDGAVEHMLGMAMTYHLRRR